MLEYFFTDADAKFFKSLGLNCLRLPFNYKHFEDDMNPRQIKPEGFKHLDRVINICARHQIWTVLDLHAVPGWQNGVSACLYFATLSRFEHKNRVGILITQHTMLHFGTILISKTELYGSGSDSQNATRIIHGLPDIIQ